MPPRHIPPALQRKLYSKRAPVLLCPFPSCHRVFRNLSGLSQHKNSAHLHEQVPPEPPVHRPSDLPVNGLDQEHPLFDDEGDEDYAQIPGLFRNIHPTLNGIYLIIF